MKKFVVFTILSIFAAAMSFAQYKETINEQWVKNASLTRQSYVDRGDVYELIQYDRDTLGRINDADFDLDESGVRRFVGFLHSVVIDNPRPDERCLIRAIDILTKKVDNKSYCADFMLELVSTNKIPNYRVMVKLMDTYTAILSNETASKIFMGLSMLYGKLDAFMFDPYAPGADMVLRAFMEFIGKYCDMVTNKKTLDDNYRGRINEFAEKLDLGKKTKGNKMSKFADIKNWEKIGRAYYFYKIKEEYMFEEDEPKSDGM